MKTIFQNLINGNLTLAKEQAREYSFNKLYNYAFVYLNWTDEKSYSAARYLKNPTQTSYDRYCAAN